ncbi:fused response regulator/phosphatase [Umezawaea sp. Da 62-37]|uniref:fused response regulator/phosphatase n=1 Tax=Umezawaea sp. Da 62-37 TaxID=3075927 RepID=UPI0028F721E6|nr:fused response regulator/phosphatase [Umezawaea sp. Da 62-37]WNV87245.1 fused response regulator/phosphatase [Umezawaea sp. Da 62-37]
MSPRNHRRRWGSRSGPARILVVDDLDASRYITASWLRRSGHEVDEAVTGGEALRVLGEQDYDLVMLDVHLPDMSGFEVCEIIKADPATAALPVIHVSATYVEPEDKTVGLTRGADAYLTEPVDPGELLATVEAALRYYRARMLAEQLADRLTRLTRATLAINSAAEFDALVAAAASAAADVLDTTAVAMLVTEEDVRVGTTGDAGAVDLRTDEVALITGVVATVLGDGEGVEVSFVDSPPWNPGAPAAVVVARSKLGRPPVCVAVDASAARTDEDRNLLVQLGQATAVAADGLRALTEEHLLALTLQRSLLPRALPEQPGLPMVARYVPASANAEIGGDFYEVIDLDGRILVAIGDVCGHSIEAATIMGEVRHALRAYAIETDDPATILTKLDRMLLRYHPRGGLTTMCLMLVDLDEGVVDVANAGHVHPLVVDEEGARFLDVAGPLLGIGLPHPPATRFGLPVGSLVVLTTDGLVERSDSDLDEGLESLRTAVSYGDDLDGLADGLLERFGGGKRDDIALLVFRRA